jgi:hypothetical protein
VASGETTAQVGSQLRSVAPQSRREERSSQREAQVVARRAVAARGRLREVRRARPSLGWPALPYSWSLECDAAKSPL